MSVLVADSQVFQDLRERIRHSLYLFATFVNAELYKNSRFRRRAEKNGIKLRKEREEKEASTVEEPK